MEEEDEEEGEEKGEGEKPSGNQERDDRKTRNHRETGETKVNAGKRKIQSETLTLAPKVRSKTLQTQGKFREVHQLQGEAMYGTNNASPSPSPLLL